MWHAAGFHVKKQKLDFIKGAHTESKDSDSNHLLTLLRNDARLLCTIVSLSGVYVSTLVKQTHRQK